MDDAWVSVITGLNNVFESDYSTVVQVFSQPEFCSYQNILLYGTEGIPLDNLVSFALSKRFGTVENKTHIYSKDIVYQENPYYFTVDMNNPSLNLTKDPECMASFLKSIVSHPCIHNNKHIFVLLNIDTAFTKESVYTFRVLLERFSSNVIFIGTTYHISKIEPPLKSRLLCLRVPLLSHTSVSKLLRIVNLTPIDNERNLYRAFFMAWISKQHPDIAQHVRWNIPTLAEGLPSGPEELRSLSQKIYINGITIAQIADDLLRLIKNDKQKAALISKAAYIDAMVSRTDGHRMSLYIELLLQTAATTTTMKK